MQKVQAERTDVNLIKGLDVIDAKVWCWEKYLPGMFVGNRSCVVTEPPRIHELDLRLYIRADKKRLCVDLVHLINQAIPENIELDVIARAIYRLMRTKYPTRFIARPTSDVIDPQPLYRFN